MRLLATTALGKQPVSRVRDRRARDLGLLFLSRKLAGFEGIASKSDFFESIQELKLRIEQRSSRKRRGDESQL